MKRIAIIDKETKTNTRRAIVSKHLTIYHLSTHEPSMRGLHLDKVIIPKDLTLTPKTMATIEILLRRLKGSIIYI